MNLLINEPPLQVLPSLAVKIGLNDALILQQMHYWQARSNHVYENKRWIYNSIVDWQKQFPFWSVSTVQRTVDRLVDNEWVLTGNFNKLAMDKTKWYTINYEKLEVLCDAFSQNDQMELVKMNKSIQSNCIAPFSQNDQSNTRDYTETTQEKKNSRKQTFDDDSREMFLSHHLLHCIRNNRPEFKQPNMQTWCKDFDAIMRIDERDFNEVQNLITWAQAHYFWKSNILSARKLRDQYDKLAMQKQEATHPAKNNVQPISAPQRPQLNYGDGE